MQTIKIPLAGKLAYENQLLKHHRRETKRFLVDQRDYTGTEIEQIMRYYDKKIDTGNILKIHTHRTVEFLTALCSGNLASLYNHSSVKIG